MRDIKFRAWFGDVFAVSNGRMENLKNLIELGGLIIRDNSIITLFDSVKLMQFTGLKDKNGVDIYEDDIIAVSIWIDEDGAGKEVRVFGSVRWDDEYAGFGVTDIHGSEHCMDINHVMEVVGNIHENKDLLK